MPKISHTAHVFKEAALSLHQVGANVLADRNSWNVNGRPNHRAVRQMLKSQLGFWQRSCTS